MWSCRQGRGSCGWGREREGSGRSIERVAVLDPERLRKRKTFTQGIENSIMRVCGVCVAGGLGWVCTILFACRSLAVCTR